MTVPIEKWGRDHWSTFAYIETLCVEGSDAIGVPSLQKMQCNADRHPELATFGLLGTFNDGSAYAIRLADGEEIPGPDYDDWDCVDDMEAEQLLVRVGTGVHPAYTLTDRGKMIAGQLRSHKASGGNWATFRWDKGPVKGVGVGRP